MPNIVRRGGADGGAVAGHSAVDAGAAGSAGASGADASAADASAAMGGETVTLEIAEQSVTVRVNGSELTITQAPTNFRAPLQAWAVQRASMPLDSDDAARESCKQPLDVADSLNKPLYALREVLLNPLASRALLREAKQLPGMSQVSHVTNPLVVEGITLNNDSLQLGLPRGVVGNGDLDATDFPRGPYDWSVLCRGVEGQAPMVSAQVRGQIDGEPHELTVEYSELHIVADP